MIALRLLPALLAAAFVLPACTPTHSSLSPYRDNGCAASILATRARAACALRRGGGPLPPHAFTTDGCSMAPDGDWASCCVEHDIAYWCGGSSADRVEADRVLAACMDAKHPSRRRGAAARFAVRLGGAPWEPFPWRWGYGWGGFRGYEELSAPL